MFGKNDFDFDLEEKKNGKLVYVLLGLVILLLLLLVTLLAFSLHQEKNGKKEESVQVETTETESEKVKVIKQHVETNTEGVAVLSEEASLDQKEGNISSDGQQSDASDSSDETVSNTALTAVSNADSGNAGLVFSDVNETVTAKDSVNLRKEPSQAEGVELVGTLHNGEQLNRIGVSESGWSKLLCNGVECYAVSSYLTTDLSYVTPVSGVEDDGINTVFTKVDEQVTPKIEINLRALPSVTNPDAVVVATIHNGEVVQRTGVNTDVGWSRVVYNGQTLYCVSSYLTTAQ